MENLAAISQSTPQGGNIINRALSEGLDSSLLYSAVIDLSSKGLLTANCINMAAGILLSDLGLPRYFFQHIQKESLIGLLQAIANSIQLIDGRVVLYDRVGHIDFDLTQESDVQWVRIATAETRDSMEAVLSDHICGHPREYYFSPQSNYYTYIIRPETVSDYREEDFSTSRYLFSLAGDYQSTPEPTRKRYEKFLINSEKSVTPLIEVFNLPETGETRLMFNSDFATPQLPLLRKLLGDHGFTILRAYWEPYLVKSSAPSSICAIYIQGELTRAQETPLLADLRAFLSFSINSATELYLNGELTFHEMLFAGNVIDFTHLFIFNESENEADGEILLNLTDENHQDTFAKRLHSSNKSIYGASLIEEVSLRHGDLFKFLFQIFEQKFNPKSLIRTAPDRIEQKWAEFDKILRSRFIDFSVGYDIFKFMFKIVTSTLKTNFYKEEKRSFSFRFDHSILDPLVFNQPVYGVFFVNGHYSCGTHLRADDIARGGLRLLRVSQSNHDSELDNAVLLNYALGPKAQRLKHKDICESGSKGVIVPHPHYACYSMEALLDYSEGIMDLTQPDSSIIDYLGKPELLFFGPDEGTAPLMDALAMRAKERGYPYWRTLTTGKSFGIPHDTYGLLDTGELFGLFDRGAAGVELEIDGKRVLLTNDMDEIHDAIGGRIETSGMTTTGVMSAFRSLLRHDGASEDSLNLMITGGPDGDLGANEIQCYKGRICLVIDGGSVLFDPEGLDRKELMKLAFGRNSQPRFNTMQFPLEKLSRHGFRVPLKAKNITLPDGTVVEDGALFHRSFLYSPENRRFIRQAKIEAFIPCGGFKDTINQGNVRQFTDLFRELRFIVEGANVFFDNGARRYIAMETGIKHIKDSTANKGGVYSSSIAEVLTAFLFQEGYEENLLSDSHTRCDLIRNILQLVIRYCSMETDLLLQLNTDNPATPMFELSERTSEQIFALQSELMTKLDTILEDEALVWLIMQHYIPAVLIDKLGRESILTTLNSAELHAYRDAIITKKSASMAFYRFGRDWDTYRLDLQANFPAHLYDALQK